MDILEPLRALVESSVTTGYRGLAVVFGNEHVAKQVIGYLDSVYRSAAKLAVGFTSQTPGWENIGFREYRRVLGREYRVVAVYGGKRLEANVIAGLAETVTEGGTFTLLCPLEGCGGWTREFETYVLRVIASCRNHVIVRAEGDRVEVISLNTVRRRDAERRTVKITSLPEWLTRLVATKGQADAIKAIVDFMDDDEAGTVLVTGNRGRGKSAALGLALSLLIRQRKAGIVPVTGPSLEQVEQVFVHLARGLKAARIRYRAWRVNGLLAGVKGAWFKVSYMHPDERLRAGVVFIDEAAAIGPARVRRLVSEARKIVIATTVHGYEGSGKTFLQRLLDWLPKPRVVELSEPIRYLPGDPLEECIYRLFMLDAEPDSGLAAPSEPLAAVGLARAKLVEDYQLLRRVYAVLVLAHYRNSPNDLQAMLEDPSIEVYALMDGSGAPISVAEVRLGDPMLKDIVYRNYGVELAKAARVVRIATLPSLQRRGFGSRLLAFLEDRMKEKGMGAMGASFSNTDAVGFWLRNGYAIVYVSPRFNRATGEKNMVALKPLTISLAEMLSQIYADFRVRLITLASTVYRDVPGEVIAKILSSCPPWYREPRIDRVLTLTPFQEWRLKRLAEGDYPELAMDAVKTLLESYAHLCKTFGSLSEKELLALTYYIVQGKPVWDTVKLLGLQGREQLEELIRRASLKILAAIGSKDQT